MLLDALRRGYWRIAQVELVGRVECNSPDLYRVLVIGDTYEINDREYQATLTLLGDETAKRIRWAVQRDEVLPADQPLAEQLWHTLTERGWLHKPTHHYGETT